MQFKGKQMNQTWDGEKANYEPHIDLFGPNFDPKFFERVAPLLDVRHYPKVSFYAISRKKYDPSSIK